MLAVNLGSVTGPADIYYYTPSTADTPDGLLLDNLGMLGVEPYPTVNETSLSVELASFSSRCKGQAVILEWITESEVDNLGFILERSENNSS